MIFKIKKTWTVFLLSLILSLSSSLNSFCLGPQIQKHFVGDFKTLPQPRSEWIQKTLKLRIGEVGHNIFAASFYLSWKPGQTNILGQGEGSVNRRGRLVFYFKDNHGNEGYGILRKIPKEGYTYNCYELNLKITHLVHKRTAQQYRTYIVQKQTDNLFP